MSATVREHIAAASAVLVPAGLDPADAAIDAEVLARHILGWDRADLLTRRHLPAPPEFLPAFHAALSRRIAREPVALIIGRREFWGLELEVTGDVLVPRPETELVIQAAIDRSNGRSRFRKMVDVGTGSGCLAVALAVEFSDARVLATDLSAPALAVAARNVARHNVSSRIQLLRGHLLDAVDGPVDLIVSNPPYIAWPDRATLQPEVARYEPEIALFADAEGTAIIHLLLETAGAKLAPNGLLLIEFGAGQEACIGGLAQTYGWSADIMPDLAGRPRAAALSRRT